MSDYEDAVVLDELSNLIADLMQAFENRSLPDISTSLIVLGTMHNKIIGEAIQKAAQVLNDRDLMNDNRYIEVSAFINFVSACKAMASNEVLRKQTMKGIDNENIIKIMNDAINEYKERR